ILPRDLDYEPYVGYHGDDWQGTPINENMNWGFYEGDPGTFCVYMLRQGMGDCPEEEFNYWMDFLSENKSLPYEYAVFGTVTHKVENVLFFYADYTDDPEVLSVCDRAYEQFLKDTGLTPEY
ncbi:MAG: hypothetical protein J6Q41_00175, partial [Firmicutes bacterium]|nr:hypothetical protein [Bacillota bacterium]